ncbi:hypothetical protein GCM10027019_31400 [Melaminivora jejuensis]|uniref:hypothetical protein n=1 Tax=Melaminivora jejuensis TaxID=1267217 RepID=UPI001AE07081|nr:hypothetical protein [Melaminivora jejuensis]UHJ63553.1 hypothetical protein LVC68_08845 [Melaminivora jejuensis]
MIEIVLPSSWASALINNDWSGYDQDEVAQIKTWVKKAGLPEPVSCGEDFIGDFQGEKTVLCTYFFLKK